jgi:hypothetical protein
MEYFHPQWLQNSMDKHQTIMDIIHRILIKTTMLTMEILSQIGAIMRAT